MIQFNIQYFKDEIEKDITWRNDQLGIIKQNASINHLSQERVNVILKYSPVAIYALFEGFVVKSFLIYIKTINEIDISINYFITSVIDRELEYRYNFSNEYKNIQKRLVLVENIKNYFMQEKINLTSKVETKSNINLKVLNELFVTFGIEKIEDIKVENKLNKLLNFRNNIAHGEDSIDVKLQDINDFSLVISQLIEIIYERLEISLKDKSFLKKDII